MRQPWMAIVQASGNTARRIERTLERMGVAHARALGEASCRGGRTVYIVAASAMREVPVPRPAIIICDGVSVPDTVLSKVTVAEILAIDLQDLSPPVLFSGFVSVYLGVAHDELRRHLTSGRRFRHLPSKLLKAFLQSPSSLRTLRDIALALGESRQNARKMVRDAGFKRSEHLLVALRAAAWRWCSDQGVSRRISEEFLGISYRGTFRRACRRAQVPLPWSG